MIEGAKALMAKNPKWIKSSNDTDGLPPLENDEGERNDFAVWLSNNRENLPRRSPQLNCWQAVLVSAHCGGLVTKKQLKALHEQNEGKEDTNKALLDSLGRDTTRPINESSPPPAPGDIILIDNEENVGFHVFIAGNEKEKWIYNEEKGEEEQQNLGYVYSHDKSDRTRGVVYDSASGYSTPGYSSKGFEDSMVHRKRMHVVKYAQDSFMTATYGPGHNKPKSLAEIRYLSPEVFRRLPE